MSQINLSQSKEENQMKKSYDDISYQKRIKLLHLINDQRWTIRSAANELGIKLCTAKYILYQFRRTGKISQRKKTEIHAIDTKSSKKALDQQSIQYVYVPFPVYIYCFPSQETGNVSFKVINGRNSD